LKIKVLIVDDSILIRAVLRGIIEQDSRFEVVNTASNGAVALQQLKHLNVDVVTMDIQMPVKNGLETLKEIMEGNNPIPVVMLSSLTKTGAKETIEALSYGAVDFILKPDVNDKLESLKHELCEKLYYASLTRKKIIPLSDVLPLKLPKKKINISENAELSALVVIGSSTGGPKALQILLDKIPPRLKAAFVIVQHMPDGGFTKSMAETLNQTSIFHVKEAEEGERVTNGKVLIAPGGFHLELFKRSDRINCVLNKREPVSYLRPSVDVLFASVSRLTLPIPVIAIVLTGMGSDGTNGAKSLKRNNVSVIAESEKTAIVYGMPLQIIKNGLADYIEDIDQIMNRIVQIIN
jgi:two-component system chemotaxis response regulator CheB